LGLLESGDTVIMYLCRYLPCPGTTYRPLTV
jgi:hypothetical protein